MDGATQGEPYDKKKIVCAPKIDRMRGMRLPLMPRFPAGVFHAD